MKTLRSTVILINGGISQIEVTGKRSVYLKIGISFLISLIILLGWLLVQPAEIGRDLVEAIGFSVKVTIIIVKAVSWGLR